METIRHQYFCIEWKESLIEGGAKDRGKKLLELRFFFNAKSVIIFWRLYDVLNHDDLAKAKFDYEVMLK